MFKNLLHEIVMGLIRDLTHDKSLLNVSSCYPLSIEMALWRVFLLKIQSYLLNDVINRVNRVACYLMIRHKMPCK